MRHDLVVQFVLYSFLWNNIHSLAQGFFPVLFYFPQFPSPESAFLKKTLEEDFLCHSLLIEIPCRTLMNLMKLCYARHAL